MHLLRIRDQQRVSKVGNSQVCENAQFCWGSSASVHPPSAASFFHFTCLNSAQCDVVIRIAGMQMGETQAQLHDAGAGPSGRCATRQRPCWPPPQLALLRTLMLLPTLGKLTPSPSLILSIVTPALATATTQHATSAAIQALVCIVMSCSPLRLLGKPQDVGPQEQRNGGGCSLNMGAFSSWVRMADRHFLLLAGLFASAVPVAHPSSVKGAKFPGQIGTAPYRCAPACSTRNACACSVSRASCR
jgi:hypothetical protein